MYRIIAEKALGHPLPSKAQVHHIDRNPHNNSNDNLIICENRAYHILLHARQRVIDAGGHPDIHRICSSCRQVLKFSAFPKSKYGKGGLGIHNICRQCMKDTYDPQYRHDRYIALKKKRGLL